MKKISFSFLAVLLLLNLVSAQTKVACVGNSITAGFVIPIANSYPSQLQTLLGTTNWTVSNFGKSGATLMKSGDKPYWTQTEYNSALTSSPNIVIIKLGTNDSKSTNWTHKDEYITDYKAMISAFRALASKPEIYICKLAPAGTNTFSPPIDGTVIANEINPKIEQIAIDEHLNLIDIYTALNGTTGMFNADGVHPNIDGAGIIAATVQAAITASKPVISQYGNTLSAPDGNAYSWYKDDASVTVGNTKDLVISQNGSYRVSVKSSAENANRLVSNLYIIDGTSSILSISAKEAVNFDSFTSDQTEYHLNVPYGISSISLTPSLKNDGFVIINGTKSTTNQVVSVALNAGTETAISVVACTSGMVSKEYKFSFLRAATDVKTENNSNEIKFYPQNNYNVLQVENVKGDVKLSIYDLKGQLISSTSSYTKSNTIQFSISHLLSGVYICKIGEVSYKLSIIR